MPPHAFFPFDEIAQWHAPGEESGAGQMALDEVMLRMADRPVLRIYRWERREVTFGYPQRWEEARDFAGSRLLTRRCTGGGLVEHGEDATVALAVPAAHPFSRLTPAETYRRIHEAIRQALHQKNLRLMGDGDCAGGPACFASPAPSDVMLGGRKIAGGAQRRSRDGFLYQGSVQGISVDENFGARLAETLARNSMEWAPAAAWERLRDDLTATRYGSDEWNRRR
jgi:lipoate-protein ligase A